MEPKKPNPYDLEISHILAHLSGEDPSSEEYKVAVDNLKVLVEAKNYSNVQLPWESIIKASAYLLATAIIVNHERFNVISSKAFGWIRFG